jgi:hypothetical protein
MSFQNSNESLFYDMPKDLILDEWDLATGDILDKVQDTSIVDDSQREKFQSLARQFDKKLSRDHQA